MGKGDIIKADYHNGIVNHISGKEQSSLADFGSGKVNTSSGLMRTVRTGELIRADDVNSLINELESMCNKSGYYNSGGRVNIRKVSRGEIITDIMGSIVNKANEIASYCMCYGNCRQTCRGGCKGNCRDHCSGTCSRACSMSCRGGNCSDRDR